MLYSGNYTEYIQRDKTVQLPLATQAFVKYGIPKSVVAHALPKYWNISDEIRYQCLETYFTRVWTAEWILHKQSESTPGTIYDKLSDTAYVIVYKDITRHTITLSENAEMELFLSFRKAMPLYNLPAYVIIKQKGKEERSGNRNET